jgi:hypothetical protein
VWQHGPGRRSTAIGAISQSVRVTITGVTDVAATASRRITGPGKMLASTVDLLCVWPEQRIDQILAARAPWSA